MAFTLDQLKILGFSPQPDGSFSAPTARLYAKPKPMDPQTKAHPHGLPHPKPQQIAAQALDGRPQSQAGSQGGAGAGVGPRFRLIIARHSSRPLDADNLAGGCKPLIDAIRRAGLIPDDDPKSVHLEFAQHGCKRGEERTEIEVYTLAGLD